MVEEPEFDLAIAHATLRAASAGHIERNVRLYRPPSPMVVFGRRDTRARGFPAAIAAAREAGFTPAVRVTGGRAVAYTKNALIVDIVERQADAMLDHGTRFDAYGALYVHALRALGVDARIGPVPGEYCPGAQSVNARGVSKLVGTSQRVIRDAWLFSALVVLGDRERLQRVLTDVYRHLEQPFDAASVGAVVDEVAVAEAPHIGRALTQKLTEALGVTIDVSERMREPARALMGHHRT